MGTADLLKRGSIRMPGRSPGPIKAALTQPSSQVPLPY
jgi:hypothetical protein